MTAINFELSSALKHTLGQNASVHVHAFGAATSGGATSLVTSDTLTVHKTTIAILTAN